MTQVIYSSTSMRESSPHAWREVQTGIYRHYKGPRYMVLGVVRHHETDERMVLYVGLEKHGEELPMMNVRPLDGPEGFFTPADGGRNGSCERFQLETPIYFDGLNRIQK